MSGLIALWPDAESEAVAHELEKLFVLQDRPLSKEKKIILVNELSKSGRPSASVIAGIRKLMDEDLRHIKKATILEAADDFISNEPQTVACDDCSEGMVLTRDDKGRYFSLACTCQNGNRHQLTRWNGQKTQFLPERDFYVAGVKHTLEGRLVEVLTASFEDEAKGDGRSRAPSAVGLELA